MQHSSQLLLHLLGTGSLESSDQHRHSESGNQYKPHWQIAKQLHYRSSHWMGPWVVSVHVITTEELDCPWFMSSYQVVFEFNVLRKPCKIRAQTPAQVQWSHASVGLAQAHPSYITTVAPWEHARLELLFLVNSILCTDGLFDCHQQKYCYYLE